MKKILVTTDFSVHSRAAMRFAIQLASQHKCKLTFFHSYYLLKPSKWSMSRLAEYEEEEKRNITDRLTRFVTTVCRTIGIVPQSFDCVVQQDVNTGWNIMNYAQENGYDFICISTRGAGKLRKIIGTTTSSLIDESAVPVIAVPSGYRSSPLNSVLFASDLGNLEAELKKVVAFAKPLGASVELLHFTYTGEHVPSKTSIAGQVKRMSQYPVKVHFEAPDEVETFITNIESVIRKTKPSMLVMFTDQNRGFFQKLLLSSKSAEYSFHPKIPLLVFNKA